MTWNRLMGKPMSVVPGVDDGLCHFASLPSRLSVVENLKAVEHVLEMLRLPASGIEEREHEMQKAVIFSAMSEGGDGAEQETDVTTGQFDIDDLVIVECHDVFSLCC